MRVSAGTTHLALDIVTGRWKRAETIVCPTCEDADKPLY